MAKQKKTDRKRVEALLAAVRDGAPAADADIPALDWLRGDTDIDQLDAPTGMVAVAVASMMGDLERVLVANTARSKDVRKAARAAAHRLRSAGISVPEQSTTTSWSIGKEDRSLPDPRALLGLPETDGYVPYLLASFGVNGACFSGGAAGPAQGFRDDDHAHLSRSQARKILDDVRGDQRLRDIGFHEAVALLERAFDLGGGKRPGGWSHLLSHIDEGTLNSARLLDPLRALAQELDVDALHRPEPLLDGRWACPFQGSPEDLQVHFEQILLALTRDAYPDDAARRQALGDVVDAATNAALDGPQRQTWAFGMNVAALLASRSDEAEAAAVARATALALSSDCPGKDIPWAREWISRQLSWVTDMAIERVGQELSAPA